MTHFGADVTLLPSEAKPNFSTLAKVDMAKYNKKGLIAMGKFLPSELPRAMFFFS